MAAHQQTQPGSQQFASTTLPFRGSSFRQLGMLFTLLAAGSAVVAALIGRRRHTNPERSAAPGDAYHDDPPAQQPNLCRAEPQATFRQQLFSPTGIVSLLAALASLGAVVVALLTLLSDHLDHDKDDLLNHRTECLHALTALSSEIAKRDQLLTEIGGSSTGAERERDDESLTAVIGDWESEKVSCQSPDLSQRLLVDTSDVGVARNTAQEHCKVHVVDSNHDVVQLAGLWVTAAIGEVNLVHLRGWWALEYGWTRPAVPYQFDPPLQQPVHTLYAIDSGR
jgi:hypothetical protein